MIQYSVGSETAVSQSAVPSLFVGLMRGQSVDLEEGENLNSL